MNSPGWQEELRRTYDDLGADEAFEIFSRENIDNASVAEVLGQGVAQEYSSWIYANMK